MQEDLDFDCLYMRAEGYLIALEGARLKFPEKEKDIARIEAEIKVIQALYEMIQKKVEKIPESYTYSVNLSNYEKMLEKRYKECKDKGYFK